jgi:hypothetical protein
MICSRRFLKEWVAADEERADAILHHGRERGVDVARGSGSQENGLQPDGACCILELRSEPTPAMYGGEKSDRAIVAVKPANKAERPSELAAPCTSRISSRTGGFFAAVHESGCGTKLLNARALVCPELAKADMRPFRRDWAFDPELYTRLSCKYLGDLIA